MNTDTRLSSSAFIGGPISSTLPLTSSCLVLTLERAGEITKWIQPPMNADERR